VTQTVTKKTQKVTTIWHLRVPASLVAKVKRIADEQKRSVTKQAELLLEEALNGNPK
jgi:hypothetical protein